MSIERFAPAEAALKAGNLDEGLRLMEQELEADPQAPASIYRHFTAALFRRQAHERAEHWATKALEFYPRDYDLWNILGVAQRRQQKYERAIRSLRQAEKINPKNTIALSNRGNVHNDMRDGPAAVEVFTKLVRLQPSSAELQRSLGRGYWFSGDLQKALMRMSLAVKLKPDYMDGWLDLAAVTSELKGPPEALTVLDQAVVALPDVPRLHEARVTALRRSGRLREAEAYLSELRDRYEDEAWLHHQLGAVISDYDRERGNIHMERSVELAPDSFEYRLALIESLGRSRYGDEAEHLERAYSLLKDSLPKKPQLSASGLKVAIEVLTRVGDYQAISTLGSFSEIGRTWAEAGKHSALLAHLARVVTAEDRRDLVEMHRIWGRQAAKAAARAPITRPAPRVSNGKLRVGFMSSDLRNHPVAYFALPLFEHYDRSKFEVFCYSFYQGQEDQTQRAITAWVDAFRWTKDISDRDAAQMIAEDQLDMLIELGGSTHMNKLAVMAYKPAPLQASWVGYPHSAGLSEIDYLVLDPLMTPEDPGLVIEKPLALPKTWYALGERAFRDEPAVALEAPVERNGFVTFGTANNPYKYGPEVLKAWAEIVVRTPGSRFLFVRPEGGSPSFRQNMLRHFEAVGVTADRVRFVPVRGRHLPYYNEMDISLDAFPQTGGTTTCESLWMGVPVVAKVGEAVFERLSYSVLVNVGLGDLCARSTEQYIAIATELAANPYRIGELRRGLRERLKASPLGDTRQFAHDYFEMVRKAVCAKA